MRHRKARPRSLAGGGSRQDLDLLGAGELDQGSACIQDEAADLDAPAGELPEVQPGLLEAIFDLGQHPDGEVGAPVSAEIQIDVVAGTRDPPDPALDDLEAADRVGEPSGIARPE